MQNTIAHAQNGSKIIYLKSSKLLKHQISQEKKVKNPLKKKNNVPLPPPIIYLNNFLNFPTFPLFLP